jgi:hypothetical protein
VTKSFEPKNIRVIARVREGLLLCSLGKSWRTTHNVSRKPEANFGRKEGKKKEKDLTYTEHKTYKFITITRLKEQLHSFKS